MPLEAPRLDDRTFNDLLEEAMRRIPMYTSEWTDFNLSDPGITLIELFAWMTDITLYRLNRVPDKHYIKFMELIGMRLSEATPARVDVSFWLTAPQPTSVAIPAGTTVSTTRTENEPAIVFTTDIEATINIPKLLHVMTRAAGDNQNRPYIVHDLRRVESGFEKIAMFTSDPPLPNDAVYFGFEEDLSHHLLGLDFDVPTAAGAGIDPKNPPYCWEVLGGEDEQDWQRAEVDYDGTLGFNESGLIRVHLPKMQRGTRNRLTAYWVRCRLMTPEETDSAGYTETPEIKQIAVDSWGVTIPTTNVTTIRNEVLGRSDGSPGQRFYLAHTPLVPRVPGESLLVRHDSGMDELWDEVSDFATSSPNDRHYTVDSMTGEIRLAPALPQPNGEIKRYGAVPPKNAMLVMRGYRFGGGREGNVGKDAIRVLKSALPYVDRVANRRPSSGGLDAENLDDAKLRVPGYLRSLNRAVTPGDFEVLAKEAVRGEVERVYCLQPPATNAGQIRLLVIPKVPLLQGYIAPESLRLPPTTREAIIAYLDERRLISTQLDAGDPVYQWVQTEVRFRPATKSDPETVRQAVEARLFQFINPLVGGADGTGWVFGRTLFVSDIIAVLLAIPGVDFVRSVKLYPVTNISGEWQRVGEVQEISLPPDGIIASFEHTVVAE